MSFKLLCHWSKLQRRLETQGKLFGSKIQSILTDGSIIWETKSSNNLRTVDGLKEANDKTTKNLANRLILGTTANQGEGPPIEFDKRLGRKTNIVNRKILVKFVHYQDKEKIICNSVDNQVFLLRATSFPVHVKKFKS